MRIAHVAPSVERSASGILTVLGNLTTALARRGHDVELWYVREWRVPSATTMLKALEDSGVTCRPIDSTRHRGRILPVVTLPPDATADVLHVHSVFVPRNTALARAWRGPLVVSPHGGYDPVSLRRSYPQKQIYSALYERRMVRHAATTVALTDVEASQVRAYAGDVSIAVVPNGVAPRPSGRDRMAFRRRIGLPADARLGLFVGRLDVRHKGLDRLVAAAGAAPSWQFVLVGPDHRAGRRRLERLAAVVGASGRLHLVGPLNGKALTNAYAAADIYVLPSRWEGLPMSLLEALAQGVPSLVTPEVDRLVPVSASGSGWVSAPSDLGTTLEALAALPAADWTRRTAAARELARHYDWDEVAASYEEVYRAAMRRATTVNTATDGSVRR